ncbi:CHAP domain-containing protein [Acutalibacter muris]|uniref:CHAP domain-containing protein n=1 Tax=Acutalibacter muris TaxID=1796620 RepID=UPI0038B39F62
MRALSSFSNLLSAAIWRLMFPFAGCQSQGVPWFQSHGQWGARGYENLAPGDAIFFDWDLDGSADHVDLVIGTDGSRVYTVEGNSGDACKIRSYGGRWTLPTAPD